MWSAVQGSTSAFQVCGAFFPGPRASVRCDSQSECSNLKTNKHYTLLSSLRCALVGTVCSEIVMHLSMVSPRMGGPGNPRELDFVKCTWVGILTSTTVPSRVGNLTRPPSWKVERTWEWVSGPPSWKIPRSHLSEFPASKEGWTKRKEYRVAFF